MPVDSHITAWKADRSTWKGPYTIAPLLATVPAGARLLDVGSGSGKMALPLARAGYRVVALDIARGGLPGLRGEVAAVQGDARDLPFRDGSFGAVICYDVLQHLLAGERARAMDEAYRALAPGGHICFEGFGIKDMRYGGEVVEPGTFRRESGVIYHYFSEDELRGLLAGFGDVAIKETLTRRVFRGTEHWRHRIFASGKKA